MFPRGAVAGTGGHLQHLPVAVSATPEPSTYAALDVAAAHLRPIAPRPAAPHSLRVGGLRRPKY